MLFENPAPTPDQRNQARDILAGLARVLNAGQENTYASMIHEVLAGEADEMEKWLTSGDFWGGMGSMVDCAFGAPSVLGPETDRRHRREFMNLIVKLGKHQLASGIYTANIKPHIESWTRIFEGWLASGAV